MDEEKVEYSFTGDVTSLRQATEQAIGLLDKYSDQIDRLVNANAFGKNTKVMKSFEASMNSTTKSVEKLSQKLGSLSDVKIAPKSNEAQQLSSGISSVQSVLNSLASATKLSTAEVRDLTSQLKAAKQSFTDSGAGIDALVQKEIKFQNTLDNVRAKSQKLRDSMDAMKNKVSGVFDPLIAKLNTLKNPFSWITQSAQSFKDKAANAFNRVSQLADACASAFRRVQQSEDSASDAANRANRAHGGLSSILTKLRNLFKRETETIKEEEDELKKKNNTLKDSSNRHSKLRDILNRLGAMFRSESVRVSSFTANLKSMNSVTNLARKGLLALTGVRIGDWLASAVKESIDYVENLNLFTVAMGESIDKGLEFVNTMSEIYGMDPSNLYRYAGYFYQLTDAIGMTDEASSVLSLSLTKASNDIASLFNVDIETVVDNLASGMQGMSRAVRKYGMDIRTTTLQQTALNYGITDQVENMSEANRMALRYLTMMEQVKNATQQVATTTDGATEIMGDFARTIESPANQLRIFKEQITQLGRAIGNFLVPALQTVLPLVNGFIMALRTALTFIATLTGFTTDFGGGVADLTAGADAIEGIGTAAGSTAKKIKNLLGPFDELNILSQSTDSGGGGVSSELLDPALEEAIANMELNLENIEMKANKVRDSLLKFFGFDYVEVFNPDTGEYEKQLQWFADVFQNNLVNKFPQWSNTINALFANWTDIVTSFKNLFASLGGVFDRVREKLQAFVDTLNLDITFATFIENLSGKLDKLSGWIDAHAEDLANLVLTIIALVAAFKTVSTVSSVVGGLVTVLSKVSGIVSPLMSVLSGLGTAIGGLSAPVLLIIAGIAALVAILVHLWNTSDSFRESVITAVENIIEVLQNLWNSTIKPIVDNIWNSLVQLWDSAIKPVIQHVIDIVGDVIELILALWNNVLAPLINFLVSTLGPSFAGVFNDIWNVITTVIGDIVQIIDGLLQTLDGIIDFLVGVFTGDWERAWHGLVNIFVGIGNTLISVFEMVVNGIIGLVNSAISLIYNGVKALINTVLGAVEGIADILGYDLDIKITAGAPQIPKVSIPRIPEMANGGVVRSPTLAMVGEGKYDEAIIPLGNSPQMGELVDRIVDAIDKKPSGGGGDNTPIEVHVYIDSKEVTTAQNNTNRRFGKTTQNV